MKINGFWFGWAVVFTTLFADLVFFQRVPMFTWQGAITTILVAMLVTSSWVYVFEED